MTSRMALSTFSGLKVIVDSRIGAERYQFRFPRSKKTRIRKKWRRNPTNWRVRHKPTIIQMGAR